MRQKKGGEPFKLLQFRWLFLVNAIVVISAVMSFGMVAVWGLGLNENNAAVMLAVIPPMVSAVGLSTAIIMHTIRKKMGTLLNGIQAVAAGDLTVRLDPKGAEEYAPIYENFNRMAQELENTKGEMENFVNVFSHEFKTPITSIYGFSELLIETGQETESPERLKYLQIISDESIRLAELSQKTLLLSKVESCEIITDRETYDLTEQLKHCAILLLPQMEKKKITLEMDAQELSYCGNMELMEQVWVNLLNNAVKFTPENGEISIRAKEEGGFLLISVSDTGIGMDAETIPHIFQQYYHKGGKNGGNGIGLSIAHRIVTLCGGTIDVESVPGAGSTFTVRLPQQE